MKVDELRPYAKKVDVLVKILGKNEVREVVSKLDDSTHKVTEAVAGDETATILLTLWDDLIEKIEIGKTYKITNGYTTLFKNSLRLNIGRYGQIDESQEQISEVKEDNNLSEKELGEKP